MRTPCNSFPSPRDAGEKVKLELPADVVMTFAWCPAGSFRMGGTVHNDEQPIHKVTLTKGFYMGIYPVTQTQWKAVMGTDPSQIKGANRPVESVTWHECNEFCTKLRLVPRELVGAVRRSRQRVGVVPRRQAYIHCSRSH